MTSRKWVGGLLAAVLSLCCASLSFAQQPPSYAKQVLPFFTRYCAECHNSREEEGGLNLETFKSLMEGGGHGAAIVPGKPDSSRLVRMIEGKLKPFMPPKKARQPKKDEVALVRAWVLSGARDDSTGVKVTLPAIAPKRKLATPVTAVAYEPKGDYLAASGRGEVLLIRASAIHDTQDVQSRLGGLRDRVTALTFGNDGKRFAVASSQAGVAHEVRLYTFHPGKYTPQICIPLKQKDGSVIRVMKPAVHENPRFDGEQLANRHDDMIQALAFSPDGKILASASYDRLIKLWDVTENKQLRVLKDHSDSIYGIAFSPDGKMLASGAADRAVKVWDVSTGNRLYTLGESTDWVYAVAWSPDGKHLAAVGVDRSIRVWEVDRTGGKVVHSVFAHEGPITRLVYSRDGKVLYSLSEDRIIKSWDTAKMVERRVYAAQAETPLSLAVRPDGKQLAVGRYDGALVLLDEASGKVQGQPLPIKPKPPVLEKITPAYGARGRTIDVKIQGKNVDGAALVSTVPGLTATPVSSGTVKLTLPAHTAPGNYTLHLKNEAGASAAQTFTVDRFAAVNEVEPNDSPKTGQKVALPVTIVGAIDKAGDLDWYRFEAKAGQEIGVQVLTAAIGSKLDPLLRLVDPTGATVAESITGVLGHRCLSAGIYSLGILDREYRGGAGMYYRLHVGDIPIVTSVFPLGLARGTETDIQVEGVHLGKVRTFRVKAPADAAPGTRLPLPVTTPDGPPLGLPTVIVGEFPEVVLTAKNTTIPVPGTANGVIAEAGATNTWRFAARKGQRLLLEVSAQRIGSLLDSTIEILDATGRPLPRATLRCLAKTYVAFRDHDSRSPGIRLEAWSELAVNDYLLVGSELLHIRELPRNPDDDCQFFAEQGQRLGFLGTTPTHQSQGTPMYKVGIHPPGKTFPPNGLPVVTLFWRNDDGGPGFGKDSRLVFDPPADGTYRLRVADARGEGSKGHSYRLIVRPPKPDYSVSFSVAGSVSRGGAIPVRVTTQRSDEFTGEINLELSNLPAGLSAPATSIPAGENSTTFAIHATQEAALSGKAIALELKAKASIDGKEVVRTAKGSLPGVIAPGDIVTTTEQSEVTLKPGGEVRMTVKVERRNGFKGRIPLEVQGLPHGVRVLDVGLNGILVIPTETTRTIVIQADSWVQPMRRPFVVLARHEGKRTEHAAKAVLLRVVP
jgi:WD40 repeat protein